MGSREVKQFNVYLPAELIKRLKNHVVESELSLSSIVAEALRTHLDRAEGPGLGKGNRHGDRGHPGSVLGDAQLGKTARFVQGLGWGVEFETDHNSGQLRSKIGPPLFIAEVLADPTPGLQLVLSVSDVDAADARLNELGAKEPFEKTHFGTHDHGARPRRTCLGPSGPLTGEPRKRAVSHE